MFLFDVTFNALFFAIVEASFPLAEQAEEDVLADHVAVITGAICHVPIIFFGKVDQLDKSRRIPFSLERGVLFKQLIQDSHKPRFGLI